MAIEIGDLAMKNIDGDMVGSMVDDGEYKGNRIPFYGLNSVKYCNLPRGMVGSFR